MALAGEKTLLMAPAGLKFSSVVKKFVATANLETLPAKHAGNA